jgi:uncharacterized Zn finger protein (UPF0148 family)
MTGEFETDQCVTCGARLHYPVAVGGRVVCPMCNYSNVILAGGKLGFRP